TYELNASFLPSTEQGLNALVEKPSSRPAPSSWVQVMKKLTLDPWGNPYNYRKPGTKDKNGYDVYSNGPDGQADTGDDIGNWDQ
ncbi:MAG: ral secretion pathway protein, partial [Verrucomicrobiaceae bacterium]|nr:ral secretion pathway protein [Verrucomicrobiaceae bacterium]